MEKQNQNLEASFQQVEEIKDEMNAAMVKLGMHVLT